MIEAAPPASERSPARRIQEGDGVKTEAGKFLDIATGPGFAVIPPRNFSQNF